MLICLNVYAKEFKIYFFNEKGNISHFSVSSGLLGIRFF